jgi:hypothetical protein
MQMGEVPKGNAEVEKMMNSDGPSARGNSAYGFSANERAEITRGMVEGEEYCLMNPDEAPRSQLDFTGWVQANHKRVFGREVYPTGAKPIKAPKVAGLAVYAAEAFGGQYYAAWSAYDGRFIGWMWYSPAMTPIDHTYAVGKVGNTPVFGDMTAHCIRRGPVRVFTEALRAAAGMMKVV